MNYKLPRHDVPHPLTNCGFTLVEVLVSVAIMAIGIAAVFGFVSISDDVLYKSRQREQLNMVATDIIEIVHSDQANIMEYVEKDLSNCAGLVTSSGKQNQKTRLNRWCAHMNDVRYFPDVTNNDIRKIRAIEKDLGGKKVLVLTVELTTSDGKTAVFAKRVFDAP